MAPPPSGEFLVRLQKPFSGTATTTIDITGEPNREANIKQTNHKGDNYTEKVGTMSAYVFQFSFSSFLLPMTNTSSHHSDDVNELTRLISQLRGFPSHETKDVYGIDARLELHTLEVNWANDEQDPSADVVNELTAESKQTFKDVVDSISAAARQFAKNDSAV
jgi:hypothetical protein